MKKDKTVALVSVIYFTIFIAICFSTILLLIFQTKSFQIRSLNRRDWFYICLILLFCYSFYLILSNKFKEVKKSIFYISTSMFLALSVYYYLIMKISSQPQTQTTLSIIISALLVCAGWWTQSTVNRSSQRKSHTLNLIMAQRYSELYMRKNDNAVTAFSLDITVHPGWAEKLSGNESVIKPKFVKANNVKPYLQHIEGVKGLSYLLNFYEFAAVGILKGDLDSKMMKDCFSGSVKRIEKRAFFMIRYSMKKDPEAYENFIKLLELWGVESLIKKYEIVSDDIICTDSSYKGIFTISQSPKDFTS